MQRCHIDLLRYDLLVIPIQWTRIRTGRMSEKFRNLEMIDIDLAYKNTEIEFKLMQFTDSILQPDHHWLLVWRLIDHL